MRKSGIIGISIATLIGISGVIAYVVLPSWQQRAAHNLDVIHHAIDEMHPAVLEPDATAFHEWHTKGYEQAKALLPLVRSPADEYALLRFYFAGYHDPHINFYGSHQYALQRWYPNHDRWTGWLFKYTNSSYKVVYSLSQQGLPQVGEQLLRCDGQEIDNLLKLKFAPFSDLRWNVPIAHDQAARSFTVDSEGTSVLNRTDVKHCDFKNTAGNVSTYSLQWQPLTQDDWLKIRNHWQTPYSLPSVREFAPNSYWVNVSDFQLGSPQAFAAHQKLLKDIAALDQPRLVVLDVRSNGGGDGVHGDEILKALLKNDVSILLPEYFRKLKSFGAQDSIYRVSQYTLWAEEARLVFLRSVQGGNSSAVKHLSSFIDNYRQALDSGKTTILNSELYPSANPATELNMAITLAAPRTIQTEVILLTNNGCVSSCLDFVEAVKLIPGVVHVGETTNADTAFTGIAGMAETFVGEYVLYMVPIKKNINRWRQDNIPDTPGIPYEGDINNTAALEKWILEIAKRH